MTNKNIHDIDFTPLTDVEKRNLRKRIFKSIQRKNRRSKMLLPLSAAAAITLLFVAYQILTTVGMPNTASYQTALADIDPSINDLQLITDQPYTIEGENGSLAYNTSGEVLINSDKKLTAASTSKFNTLVVPFGRRANLTLADGSEVWLNSGSKLVYPSTFSDDKRDVYLEGEAYFDVAHNENKTFRVLTNEKTISVLGTKFNVRAYPDEDLVSTALVSGKVEVTSKSSLLKKNDVTLRPGMVSVYNKEEKKLTATNEQIEKYSSWKDGLLLVRKDQLGDILKQVARYYNVDINLMNPELYSESFSGSIDLKEDVESVMDVIAHATDIEYKITDEKTIEVK